MQLHTFMSIFFFTLNAFKFLLTAIFLMVCEEFVDDFLIYFKIIFRKYISAQKCSNDWEESTLRKMGIFQWVLAWCNKGFLFPKLKSLKQSYKIYLFSKRSTSKIIWWCKHQYIYIYRSGVSYSKLYMGYIEKEYVSHGLKI